jgi:hypothetical protein
MENHPKNEHPAIPLGVSAHRAANGSTRSSYPSGDQPVLVLGPSNDVVSAATYDVLAERRRQIEIEHWTPDHDSEHTDYSLAKAAAAYAFAATIDQAERDVMEEFGPGGMTAEVRCVWPNSWAIGWFKPKSRRADLVKAAALILAEIERIDRAATTTTDASAPTYDLGEDRIDNALATFLAEHTNLSQDGIDTHAMTMAWAINHAALKPVEASEIAEWCEQGYLTSPGPMDGAQASQAAASEVREAEEEAREGLEILDNLIASIEKHGNYSAESTVGFLNQAKQCFEPIRSLRTIPATPASAAPKE